MFQRPSLRLFVTLAALLAFTASAPHAARAKETDLRVTIAREELKTAQQLLADATSAGNNALVELWSQRVSLAEKDLTNALRLAQIEERERKLASKRRERVDYLLREALGTVEATVPDAERDLKGLKSKVARLRSSRSDLDERRRLITEDTDEQARKKAEIEAQMLTIDAEIQATMLARDAGELRLRLAKDAARIDEFRQKLDPNPRPTIRLILQKIRAISDRKLILNEFKTVMADLDTQHKETATAVALTEERFSKADQEIAFLTERLRAVRKVKLESTDVDAKKEMERQLRRLLDIKESERDEMEQRVGHLRSQIKALDDSVLYSGQIMDLAAAEIAFLENDVSALRWRYLRRIVVPILLICLLAVGYAAGSKFVLPRYRTDDALFVARRLWYYLTVFLILMVIVSFFLEDLRAIATVLGIVGAAIVIALQDMCSAFAGWFVIVSSGKIKVGDRVEIDGRKGDVIDIQLLRTVLVELNNWLHSDEPTGRVLIIPNSFIFKNAVFNYSHIHRFIWAQLEITVTFETPARKAYDLLLKVLTEETKEQFAEADPAEEQFARRYGLRHTTLKPHIHTVIADSGVCFRLLYTANYRNTTGTRDRIMARIIEEFEKDPALQFAYPTQRIIPTSLVPPASQRADGGRASP